MLPRERVFNRIEGKPVDKIPNLNIVMAFAAKLIGVPYSRYAKDYRVLAEGNFAACRQFGIDMLSAISDPFRETSGFGANIFFPEDGIPVCKDFLVKEYADIRKLSVSDPMRSERMLDRIRAVELYKAQAGKEYPILGWVEGAFAEANDLRSMSDIMVDVYDEPAFVAELLEISNGQAIRFALEQVRAGADFIGIGDAAASLVGPAIYREFVLPYEKKLIGAIHEAGAKVKLHICGDINSILEPMTETGADIIDIDWMVDMPRAVRLFDGIASVCGNFDPVAVLLMGTPDIIRDAVKACVSYGSGTTLIAAGCEVPRETPRANLLAVHEALTELPGSVR